MKKRVTILMIVLLCIMLTACKSKEVKTVNTLIRKIGTVSLESQENIQNARNAYEALNEEDKADAKYETLCKAEAAYFDLLLEGLRNTEDNTEDEITNLEIMYDTLNPDVKQFVSNQGEIGAAWDRYREEQYQIGIRLLEEHDFDNAKTAFEKAGDYKDAPDMIEDIGYQKALYFLEEGQYDKAKTAFHKMGDYKDSKEMMKETDYQRGLAYLREDDLASATSLLSGLRDYKDYAEELYQASKKRMEEKDYERAKSSFFALGDYKDSADLVTECTYQIALEHYKSNDLDNAILTFNSIIDYADSAELVKEITYKKACYLMDGKNYFRAADLFETIIDYQDAGELRDKALENCVYVYADELITEIDSNIVRAKDLYMGKCVAITGFLESFNSKEGCFDLVADADYWRYNDGEVDIIKCKIPSDISGTYSKSFFDRNKTKTVTVMGKITAIDKEEGIASVRVSAIEVAKDPAPEDIVYKKVDLDKLCRDYISDTMITQREYLNQYITFTGKVLSIDEDHITIENPRNSTLIIGFIHCYYPNNMKQKIADLKVGSSVTISGKLTEMYYYELILSSVSCSVDVISIS